MERTPSETDFAAQADLLLQQHSDLPTACTAVLESMTGLPEPIKDMIQLAITLKIKEVKPSTNISDAKGPLIMLLKEMDLLKRRNAGDPDALMTDHTDRAACTLARTPHIDGAPKDYGAPAVMHVISTIQGNVLAITGTPTIGDMLCDAVKRSERKGAK